MEQLKQTKLKLKQQRSHFVQEIALAKAVAEEHVFESFETEQFDYDSKPYGKQVTSPSLLSDPWWSGQLHVLQWSNIFVSLLNEISVSFGTTSGNP